ncbi:MAG TPA: hypothetical protein VFV41_15310 [Streptosporangiaceae bacterium]|nr:hypothetical protein [Streptosporangiaceae bacterium]
MSARKSPRPGPRQPGAASLPEQEPGGRGRPDAGNAGWTIFSYLIAGMIAYGLIGWLIGHLTHIPILLPLGAVTGLVVAIVGVIFRYGRA